MNKLMKKLTAALVALLCMPVTGMTAAAEGLTDYWGEVAWDALKGYERIDDHGYFTSWTGYQNAEIYLNEESVGWRGIILVTPRTNTIRFVLRDDVDTDEAADQIAGIIANYIPDIRDNVQVGKYGEGYPNEYSYWCDEASVSSGFDGCTFDLNLHDFPGNKKELEAGLLLDLARKHLISEYYGWGETASFQKGYLDGGKALEYFLPTYSYYDAQQQTEVTEDINWDAVQTYLTEHYPGLTVASYDAYADIEEISYELIRYRINGAEDWSFREQMELMFELWGKFHVTNNFTAMDSAEPSVTGQNALEQPGDVDLDTKINILDVITLNRNLLVGDPLCNTAQKNADTDGSGTPDAADALRILKYIVGIEENLG